MEYARAATTAMSKRKSAPRAALEAVAAPRQPSCPASARALSAVLIIYGNSKQEAMYPIYTEDASDSPLRAGPIAACQGFVLTLFPRAMVIMAAAFKHGFHKEY